MINHEYVNHIHDFTNIPSRDRTYTHISNITNISKLKVKIYNVLVPLEMELTSCQLNSS